MMQGFERLGFCYKEEETRRRHSDKDWKASKQRAHCIVPDWPDGKRESESRQAHWLLMEEKKFIDDLDTND